MEITNFILNKFHTPYSSTPAIVEETAEGSRDKELQVHCWERGWEWVVWEAGQDDCEDHFESHLWLCWLNFKRYFQFVLGELYILMWESFEVVFSFVLIELYALNLTVE